ncbi:MAG TPA: TonB-dependent receptor, partial [Puia sp.]|nr:TonB-dependent receptor [Puia sp.]
MPLLFLVLTTLSQRNDLFAQKQSAGWKGELRGIICDTAHDSVLRSATVAIYRIKDSILLAYRLTNTNGEFSFNDLPAGTPLRLVASFVGYADNQQKITLTVKDTVVDLGRISLKAHSDQLDEVVVSAVPPPVRMNGDTLEFNSAAFRLDSAAQVEDLIRILPGVTLWMADGSITVNGRKISQVLVNGKPFFGDDPKVALQNLPKNIVDKIQVYQRASESTTKKDSSSILDIRLKKGKESGYFGKLDAGYGTSAHYESGASLNHFTARTQVGGAFISNDVNKVAENMIFILRNSTFKGNEASAEFKSDFNAPGLNKFTSAGLILQHDFTDSPSYRNQNQLSGVYFFKDNQRQLNQQTQTVTTVNDSTLFNANSQSKSQLTSYGQNADLRYDKTLGTARLAIDGTYRSDNISNSNTQQIQTTDRNHLPLSQQNSDNSSAGQNNSYSISAGLNRFFSPKASWNSTYQLNYRVNFLNSNTNSTTQTSYAAADPSQNTFIDRQYHPTTTRTDQSISFQLPYLSMLFAGAGQPKSLRGGAMVDLSTNTSRNDNDVYDVDSATKTLSVNDSLSNRQHDLGYNFQPGITLNKNWTNYSPRNPPKISNNLFWNMNLIETFHGYTSWSDQKIQNLSRSYQNFTPSAGISFTQSKAGVTKMAHIDFRTQMVYPTLQQLAPLVDNSNPNYIQYGNINLKGELLENLDFSFSNSRQRLTGGAFSWTANIKGVYSNSYIAASTEIDSLGQTRSAPINARGYRRIYISLEINKAFRSVDANKLQIQVTALPEFSIDRSPAYVNQQLSYYNNYNVVITPTLNLSYKD